MAQSKSLETVPELQTAIILTLEKSSSKDRATWTLIHTSSSNLRL